MNQDNNVAVMIYEGVKQDPSTLLTNNSINLKSFILKDNNYTIEVCEANAVNKLISLLIKKYDKELNEMEHQAVNSIKTMRKDRENEKKEHEKMLKLYETAIKENRQYKEWYGTLISPILISKELWNNGAVGQFGELIPPTRWRTGKGLSGTGGKTAIRYWLSLFEELELMRTYGKGSYIAMVGMYEALDVISKHKSILKKKVKEVGHE
jgi:uncharacterized protein (UPF0335 family)